MMEGFEKYLTTTAFIQAKYFSYYLKWVSTWINPIIAF